MTVPPNEWPCSGVYVKGGKEGGGEGGRGEGEGGGGGRREREGGGREGGREEGEGGEGRREGGRETRSGAACYHVSLAVCEHLLCEVDWVLQGGGPRETCH